ncbi:MAG: ornithine carbamoyltransferase [Desulfitobacteriaceae bacterium]
MNTNLMGKHFITTDDWTREELETIMEVADYLKLHTALHIDVEQILKNKTLFMLFFEESTRTRNAFEAGITQLGGHAHYLTPKATQIDHGEGPKDTIEVLGRYGHGIGIRNTLVGGNAYMRKVAEHARIPVYNMQCDIYHPTQAMADLYTIRSKFGKNTRGLKFVCSWTYGPGYIRPLSMAQSLVTLMPRFGMDVVLAHPKEFELQPEIIAQAEKYAKSAGVKFEIMDDMEAAFEGADIVYPKSWGPIMFTEDEQEGLSIIEKYPQWVVNSKKMALTKEESIYMHCMPADRDVEVTSEVMDGPHSVIIDEAENRLHIQKALMALTMMR